jgi:hypothetical protein
MIESGAIDPVPVPLFGKECGYTELAMHCGLAGTRGLLAWRGRHGYGYVLFEGGRFSEGILTVHSDMFALS